jgi:hypothetical protein
VLLLVGAIGTGSVVMKRWTRQQNNNEVGPLREEGTFLIRKMKKYEVN